MKTRPIAIILVLLCTLCTSIAAIMNKLAADRLSLSLEGTIFNYYLLAGLCLLGLGFVLLTISLRFGNVSVIYPILAMSYIFVTAMAYFFMNESISLFKVLAIGLILTGVVIVKKGDSQ